MPSIQLHPIGTIRSPYHELSGMPIQPSGSRGMTGSVEVYPEFRQGLSDLEHFSHIILLYHLHKSEGYHLKVVPFLDTELRGLFATRAPGRPNPIGLSIVRLDRIENGIIYIRNVDILDGTPLLDIKPYVPAFDSWPDAATGWLSGKQHDADSRLSDDRFKR